MNKFSEDQEIKKRLQEEWNEVPEIVMNRIDETLASLHEPKKRGSRMKKVWLTAAAATLAIAGTITAGFISPSFAATLNKVPVIGSIFDKVGDNGIKNAVKKGVTTNQVNQSLEKEGVKVTIKDLIYDDTSMIISYEIKSKEKFETKLKTKKGKSVPVPPPSITFIPHHNGKLINGAGSGQKDVKDDYTVIGYESIQLDQPLPDKVKLNLQANYTDTFKAVQLNKPLKPLQFEFNVTAQKEKNNQIYKPNIKKDIGDIHLQIKQVKVSSSYIQVDLNKFTEIENANAYSFSLHDEKGKELESLYESRDLKTTRLTYVSPMETSKSLTLKIYGGNSKGKEIGQIQIPLR
ncbi:DUF4179 domain-containing protein [Thermoflavimicrobium daqui]|uniref:DUF4179 domain-containing protein n=1 Tax=Thermoflavimicrobium daqui TaxID=2137476 RepID=A0A364K0W0_9BACL|nr:DUF4179 domain-containing protein [Thermoflavimicrobium daqui]RAL21328.1 hypothetical protein DL897_16965 [Thermoflavimicrobium daqui]